MSNIVIPTGTCNLFPAAPNNHVLHISRMPHLSFVIQESALPGFSANPARVMTPGLMMRASADRLTYDPLTVTFLVDEDFRAHRELHRWLNGTTGGEDRTVLTQQFVDDHEQYFWEQPDRAFDRMAATHAGMTIVNGAKTPILRILFYNVHLLNVGPVQFTITNPDTNMVMTSTATFEYDFYTIVEIR